MGDPSTHKPDRRLDTRGLLCPLPVVKTSEALGEMALGSVLEVVSDDSGIEEDLPAWCEANEQTLLELRREEAQELYRGYVRKDSPLP